MVSTDSIPRKKPGKSKLNSVRVGRALSVSDRQPSSTPIPRRILRSKSLNKTDPQEELEDRISSFFDNFFDKHPLSRQELKNQKRKDKRRK